MFKLHIPKMLLKAEKKKDLREIAVSYTGCC